MGIKSVLCSRPDFTFLSHARAGSLPRWLRLNTPSREVSLCVDS